MNMTSACVKVAKSSLQVFPAEIPLLSAAVRVAGPGLTWIRDTRDSPLDAHRGTYTSFQNFFSQHLFGSEAQFNRLDVSNSSFYGFDKNRLVIARNSRYAQERAFGAPSDELIPLPERIYSGGPNLLRGFPINGGAARPRDWLPYRWSRSAGQQHRASPAASHAALRRRLGELRSLSRYGKRICQRR